MSEKPKSKSDLEIQTKEEYQDVTLLKNPIIVISTTILLIYEQLMKLTNYIITHKTIRFILILILLACFLNGPHKQVKISNIFIREMFLIKFTKNYFSNLLKRLFLFSIRLSYFF